MTAGDHRSVVIMKLEYRDQEPEEGGPYKTVITFDDLAAMEPGTLFVPVSPEGWRQGVHEFRGTTGGRTHHGGSYRYIYSNQVNRRGKEAWDPSYTFMVAGR
jgi:hypothetical protein